VGDPCQGALHTAAIQRAGGCVGARATGSAVGKQQRGMAVTGPKVLPLFHVSVNSLVDR
jgi:hypothetical protein